MKFCGQCSTEAIESAKYCISCGTKLDGEAQGIAPITEMPRREAESDDDVNEIDSALSVTVLNMYFRPKADGIRDYLGAGVQYRNIGTKAIKAFKGTIAFYDLFNEHIYSVTFQSEKPIGIGKTKTDTIYWVYNQFKEPHKKLRFTEWKNLTAKCSISALIFENGSTLTA